MKMPGGRNAFERVNVLGSLKVLEKEYSEADGWRKIYLSVAPDRVVQDEVWGSSVVNTIVIIPQLQLAVRPHYQGLWCGEKTLLSTGLEHITSQPRDRSSAVWRRRAPTWPASPGRRPAPAAGPSWCRSPPRRRARRSAGRRCPPGDTCPGAWAQHVSPATRGHTWPHPERR